MSLSVKEILKVYSIKATKRLSQNFIVKKRITDDIVRKIDPNGLRNAFVLEVGPGPGLLTRSILDANARRVVVVEKDERFLPALMQLASNANGRLVVIHGDILTIPHEQILKHYYESKPRILEATALDTLEQVTTRNQSNLYTKAHFVGNLPFGISTVLLIRWIELMNARLGIFALPNIEMTLMFQKEVGDGICALQHQHPRSRLSVLSQALFNVSEALVLPPQSFLPPPKVSASVVKFVPREDALLEGVPFKVFEEVVKVSFGAKNKLMSNSLGAHLVDWKGLKERVGVPEEFKARSVGVAMFRDLARDVHENRIEIKSKEEVKIILEEKSGTIDTEDGLDRLVNRTQRRANALKKLEAKQRKADLKLSKPLV